MAVIAIVVVAAAATTTWFFTRDGGGRDGGGSDDRQMAVDVLGPGDGPQASPSYTFELGLETILAEESVGPDGGVINAAGGLSITVPPGAHSTTVTYRLSEFVVESHDLPGGADIASPMVLIDNGGVLAEKPVLVDLPVSDTSGDFVMGFTYDPATGSLEGLPLVGFDSDSVTIATRRFSRVLAIFLPGMKSGQVPAPVIDTQFRPGLDDWQFENLGSAAAVGGHCSGQSLSALWYFTERATSATRLNGRFDNTDGNPRDLPLPATTSLWQDDRDGYRLASAVQVEQYAGPTGYEDIVDELTLGLHEAGFDGFSYSAFGLSMWLTNEPQYVGISNWKDSTGDGSLDEFENGHAMIIYGLDEQGLHVADPNYPGTLRRIPWDLTALRLGPYETGLKAGDPSLQFEVIGYYAKSALVEWEDLGGLWDDFLAGTVGEAIFPGYTLVAEYDDADGNRQERQFRDQLVVSLGELGLTFEMGDSGDCRPYLPNSSERVPGSTQPCGARVTIYDGITPLGTVTCTNPADPATCSAAVKVELEDGENQLGALIEVERVPDDTTTSHRDWEYVDFDRFTISRGSGLALEMLPDESEAAGLDILVKDAPMLVENPDVPGEIIAITASYKAGPAVGPGPEGWEVLSPDPDDVCMGAGWGGADAGFGPNLCIDVRLSLWDGDSTPFEPAAVRTEALDVNPTPDPCWVGQPPSGRPAIEQVTHYPCVDSFIGNVDQGVVIFGWEQEDRNVGVSRFQVRAVVEGVRIDVGTAYRNYYAADVRIDRMREVVTALTNEIARSIRVVMGG